MILALALLIVPGTACTRKTGTATRVVVSGNADLKAQPDAAVLVLSVVSQASQALNAQQENARKSDAVIKAVKQTAGSDAELKTSDYSLQPQYDDRDNKLPKIIGYDARNTVSVTMTDLNGVGKVIDAATAAGANAVESISFIIRDNSPARGQVLATATDQALRKAQSIAQAMGGHVARLVEEQERDATPPLGSVYESNDSTLATRGKQVWTTPVQVGSLIVRSQVHLVVEIEGGR